MPLRDAGEKDKYDSRILGDGDFVAKMIREAEKKVRRYLRVNEMKRSMDHAIQEICRKEGVAEQELRMGVRTRKLSRVRVLATIEREPKVTGVVPCKLG